jgi:signal transduction histidine kinase
VTVSITHDAEGGVRVCVADTGCGIAQEHLHRVFEEFSRIPSSIPSSQGTQLGLFITKSLVTMHHGTIWVESIQDVGTRFYITLPPTAPEPQRPEP